MIRAVILLAIIAAVLAGASQTVPGKTFLTAARAIMTHDQDAMFGTAPAGNGPVVVQAPDLMRIGNELEATARALDNDATSRAAMPSRQDAPAVRRMPGGGGNRPTVLRIGQ